MSVKIMKIRVKAVIKQSMRCGGFTLIEMLVVIGIIGILSAALMTSFSYMKVNARQAQAQALVSETASALTFYLQSNREWPDELSTRTEMDLTACWVLQKEHLLDVTGGQVYSSTNSSLDRFGLLDPWGRAALRKNPMITSDSVTIEGGTKLSDHRIQYRLDLNMDGYVDQSEGAPMGVKVRAPVIVWSRGPDGKDDADKGGSRYPRDDRLSWNYDQARKESQ